MINEFLNGYVTALLWSMADSNGQPLGVNYTASDFDAQMTDAIRKDCLDFYLANLDGLNSYVAQMDVLGVDYWDNTGSWQRAGTSFWLSRQKIVHEFPEILDTAAQAYGPFGINIDLYEGKLTL